MGCIRRKSSENVVVSIQHGIDTISVLLDTFGGGLDYMSFEETFLNIRGTKIQMLKGGSGDPLLYLHSAGGEVAWLPF